MTWRAMATENDMTETKKNNAKQMQKTRTTHH